VSEGGDGAGLIGSLLCRRSCPCAEGASTDYIREDPVGGTWYEPNVCRTDGTGTQEESCRRMSKHPTGGHAFTRSLVEKTAPVENPAGGQKLKKKIACEGL
jgi:hypothetical protein